MIVGTARPAFVRHLCLDGYSGNTPNQHQRTLQLMAANNHAAQPADVPAVRKRNYSANIGLIVVVVVVMGGAILIITLLGLGASTIIGGFTAIFFTLGVGGGSLRADLRKVTWYGPLIALSATVPRILAAYSLGGALALVCVIISWPDCCRFWAKITLRPVWALVLPPCWGSLFRLTSGRPLRSWRRRSLVLSSSSCCEL